MTIPELERQINAARERQEQAIKALSFTHKGGEWDEFHAASESVLRLERELAAARGEEYAVPLDIPVRWDIGAPLPHLIANDHKTFLTFYVNVLDPDWDGSYATIKDPADGSVETLALVEFVGCSSAKLGSPNDEVFEGHPLSGKGMETYAAQRVVNSRWLAELEAINSVHTGYEAARCCAISATTFSGSTTTRLNASPNRSTIEVFHESMPDLLARVCKKLN